MEYVKVNQTVDAVKRFLRTLLTRFLKYVLYFTKQARFDRAQMKKAFAGNSVERSRAQMRAVWESKRKTGRLLIQQGGEIKAPPFPPRGSLLTDEEKKDPLA